MKHHRSKTQTDSPPPWYRGANVPRRVIRRFADEVAERFRPDKIILFGSHAYGTPHADSDVDILVVMPARNELGQAMRIRLSVDYSFPLDLLVRTPGNLAWRLADGDSFLKEILAKGKVLYEKDNPRVGAKGRGRSLRRSKARSCSLPSRPVIRGSTRPRLKLPPHCAGPNASVMLAGWFSASAPGPDAVRLRNRAEST